MFAVLDRLIPRGIRPLWAAANVSLIGDSLHDIAILWLIYDLTGSSTATGLLGVARYLPSILLGIFAGAWVDRVPRKSVLLWCDALRVILVLAIAALTFTHTVTGTNLYCIAFAIAICTVFFNPARDAIVPQLVPPSQLMRATSVLQSSLGVAYFVGPLLAALFLPVVGLAGLFTADAATYLLSFLLILLVRPQSTQQITVSATPWQMITEGLRYARKSAFILPLLWVTAVDNLFIMGLAIVGAPVYVREHLKTGCRFLCTSAKLLRARNHRRKFDPAPLRKQTAARQNSALGLGLRRFDVYSLLLHHHSVVNRIVVVSAQYRNTLHLDPPDLNSTNRGSPRIAGSCL